MGAKVSEAMIAARAHIKAGKSPAEAARLTGLHRSAISQDAECKKLISEAAPGKLATAVRMIKASSGRITAYEAAKTVGIHQSAISRSPEYQKFKKGLDDA